MMRFSFLSLLLLVIIDCNISTPPELRNLSPVTITVLNGDQPVENVHVSLASKEPQHLLYGCGGVTGFDGCTKIQTTIREHVRNGAIPGSYSITLRKIIVFPADLEPSETEIGLPEEERKVLRTKREAFEKQNQIIPNIFEQQETSPITLTVESRKTTELTIDISKH
jgi:hypothetical protein